MTEKIILGENYIVINNQLFNLQPCDIFKHYDSLEALKLFISMDDINSQNNSAKDTLLHRAVENYSGKTAIFLIENGANVNLVNRFKKSALFYTRSDKMTKILIDAGAIVQLQDEYGTTPLHIVAGTCMSGSLQMLIDAGANVNSLDKFNRTPLHQACHSGYLDNVKVLLSSNADPNLQTTSGDTPLHNGILTCSPSDRYEIVSLLLRVGAKIDIDNNRGKTPLDLASKNEQLYKLLKSFELVKIIESGDFEKVQEYFRANTTDIMIEHLQAAKKVGVPKITEYLITLI